MNVFISYAKEDKSIVSRLEEIVRHGGGRGWQFVYDLKGARDWATEIQYEIDRCEVFLFVMTENSLQSEWCRKELQHAALIQKPIVPVVLTSDIEIPHPLNSIQYVLYDESPESGAKLTRALQDPHPISCDKIPSHWERLGSGPLNVMAHRQSGFRDIPIPLPKRELTDLEKEDFLFDAIQEIHVYFERALAAFKESESRIMYRIRKASVSDLTCQIYLDGELKKACRIWVSTNIGLNGLAYSEARGHMALDMGGINELAQVTVSDGNPALEFTLSLMMFAQEEDCKICTVDKAAERLWRYFTQDFNQDTSMW